MKRARRSDPPRAAEETAPEPSASPAEWRYTVLLLLFAASGCSALIYEILWFHLLGLVVGSSALSLGILLATYMGGLGLGSVLCARFVPASAHPLRAYALLEWGVGAFAALVYVAVPLAGRLSLGSGGGGLWGVLARALIAATCLLPPTMLMGATLPVISRWVRTSPAGVGRLGVLYGANIAGAMLGCLGAGFYLMRVHGLVVSLLAGMALNAIAGAVSWAIARHAPHVAASATTADAPGPRTARAVHAVLAVSGLCALGCQVVWTRVLALLMGATVYTFSIILGVFLFGLGLGSAVAGMLARTSANPKRDLGACQLLLGLAIAWSAYAVNRSLPWWPIQFTVARDPWIVFQMDLARAAWSLLPPTVLWGASFPLAIAAARGRDPDSGAIVGRLYAANTLGAIVGALAATFLIPMLGSRAEQQWMAVVSAAAGLVLLVSASREHEGRAAASARIAFAVLGAVAVAFAALRVPPLPEALVALGRFATFRLNSEGARDGHDPYIKYMGEGLTESVAVSEKDGVRVFHVSGKIEASTSYIDMRLQRMLGHLPGLVNPEPRSVLVVGCGAGVTAGSFVSYPSVRRIVICEIEPMVPSHVTPFFRDANQAVLSDARVEVVIDDARHFVLTTREKFDIITSDPIHPWVKGSASLYSDDYFRLVRRLLNPGGAVTQWVPAYQASEQAVKSEAATFFSVFPHGTLWAGINQGAGFDMVMLGTAEPARFDLAALSAHAADPERAAIAQSLLGVGFRSPFELLSTYLGSAEDLKPWLAGAHINHDRQPWLQYQAGWDSYVQQPTNLIQSIAAYRRFPNPSFVGSDELRAALLKAEADQASAQAHPAAGAENAPPPGMR